MKPDSGQLAATDDEPALRDKFMHNAFWISFWLVFAVPSAAFSAASTGSHGTSQNVVVGVASWLGAGFASVAAVVCATVLMISSRPQRKHW